MSTHYGRSWMDTRLEDECPCEKAPCGLVDARFVNPDCLQHPFNRAQTIRQSHNSNSCPATVTVAKTEVALAVEKFFESLDQVAQRHGLNSKVFLPLLEGQASDDAYDEWVAETWEFPPADGAPDE